MSKKVRVGVVGTSWWSDLMYLPSLKSHPEAELVALCGRKLERTQEMAEKYGVKNIYTSFQEMLEQARLDAVIIGTPDDLHYPMTMAALDASLHVMCDKPLALNAKDAEAMYQKAEARGLKHMVLFTYRWLPWHLVLKQKMTEAYSGEIFHSSFHFTGNHARQGGYAWRFDARRANGILADFGAHIIDLAHWYIGRIVRVNARLHSFCKQHDENGQKIPSANDFVQLMLEFENGSLGTIQLCAATHTGDRLTVMQIGIAGKDGTLELENKLSGSEESVIVRGTNGNSPFDYFEVPSVVNGNALDNYLATFTHTSAGPRAFIDAILEAGPTSPSFYEGLLTQKVIEAAKISDETRSWVVVS